MEIDIASIIPEEKVVYFLIELNNDSNSFAYSTYKLCYIMNTSLTKVTAKNVINKFTDFENWSCSELIKKNGKMVFLSNKESKNIENLPSETAIEIAKSILDKDTTYTLESGINSIMKYLKENGQK